MSCHGLRRAAAGQDPHLGELRQVFLDRVVELELALLVEREECNGGDRFRHRVDAMDGVGSHRLFGLATCVSKRVVVDEAAATHHREG